jgi:signal transduction histidine kinase
MSTQVDGDAPAGGRAQAAQRLAEVAVHEERRRLALQMHDTVGAMLFSIGASVQQLRDEDDIPPGVRDRLAGIAQQANEAVDTLRRSLRALYAPGRSVPLAVALHDDCRAFEERTGIPAQLVDLTDVPDIPVRSSVVLAETGREALRNVEKHAGAQSVVVTVAALGGRVTVTVVDDGVGLAGARDDGAGLGLAAARERLTETGGGLRLEDNDDGGLTLRAWVPL